ncbi:hypothetical protein AMECASPLE_035031 [Ameca splendens]|uniref:Uncharacterized protein n=1 Tax=Ameca splendens TaxID=208324 RepID=A0ABV0XK95_9TELE
MHICKVERLHAHRGWIDWSTGTVRTRSIPLTILNNTVSNVDHLWFLETTLSSNRETVWKKAQHRLYFLQQDVQPSTGEAGHLLHLDYSICSLHIHHCVVWSNCNEQLGLQREPSGSLPDLPSIQDFYRPRVRKGAANIFAYPTHPTSKLFRL